MEEEPRFDVPGIESFDVEAYLAGEAELQKTIGAVVISFQIIELFLAEKLAALLGMSPLEDRQLVVAAMSFRQKVDLTCELMTRQEKHLRGASIRTVKATLTAAEEFRNNVVHSSWVLRQGMKWYREKSNLKGRNGYRLSSTEVDFEAMPEGISALKVATMWQFEPKEQLQRATDILKAFHHDAGAAVA